MRVYINNWEHYSGIYASAEAFRDGFFVEQSEIINSMNGSPIKFLDEPSDLYDYIEKRGSGKKSNFTKVTSYIAKKLSTLSIPDKRLGIIMATEFGNIIDMWNLSSLAHSSPQPISAQVFPNATISSATVTASIAIQAKGFNTTINSGVLSFYYALMIAKSYIEDDKLDACVVIVGDDYNQFAMEDINTSYMKFDHFLSTINGVMLSKFNNKKNSVYIKDIVIAKEDTVEVPFAENIVYGYYKSGSDKLSGTIFGSPNIYIGPSIAFGEMLYACKSMEGSMGLQEFRILSTDNGLVANLIIGKELSQ